MAIWADTFEYDNSSPLGYSSDENIKRKTGKVRQKIIVYTRNIRDGDDFTTTTSKAVVIILRNDTIIKS